MLATNEIAALFSRKLCTETSGQGSTPKPSRPRPKLNIIALKTTTRPHHWFTITSKQCLICYQVPHAISSKTMKGQNLLEFWHCS